ncbi:MAG: Rv3235 family protein [Micropruina sp.]|nr:hypothetical protein [Micropruina sp.]
MHPIQADRHPIPLVLPSAQRTVTPTLLAPAAQPTLPWPIVPEVIAAADGVPTAARQQAAAMMVAIAEVLRGHRSAEQLQRWATPAVIRVLSDLQASRAGAGVALSTLRVQAPRDDVIEIAARLTLGGKSVALAARMDRRGDSWQCTGLEIALSGAAVYRAG